MSHQVQSQYFLHYYCHAVVLEDNKYWMVGARGVRLARSAPKMACRAHLGPQKIFNTYIDSILNYIWLVPFGGFSGCFSLSLHHYLFGNFTSTWGKKWPFSFKMTQFLPIIGGFYANFAPMIGAFFDICRRGPHIRSKFPSEYMQIGVMQSKWRKS